MLRRSDWMGIVAGVVVIGLLAAAVATWTHRTQQSMHEATQAGTGRAAKLSNRGAFGARDELAALIGSIPKVARLPDRLEAIHRMIDRNGLRLVSANYRLLGSQADQLGRYEMDLVVDGPYYATRLFLRNLFESDPFVALHAIDFRRQSTVTIAPSQIRNRLTLLLYVAEQPVAVSP